MSKRRKSPGHPRVPASSSSIALLALAVLLPEWSVLIPAGCAMLICIGLAVMAYKKRNQFNED